MWITLLSLALTIYLAFKTVTNAALTKAVRVFTCLACMWIGFILGPWQVPQGTVALTGVLLLWILAVILTFDAGVHLFRKISWLVSLPFYGLAKTPLYLKQIYEAAEIMARKKIGALIVIERKDNLQKVISGGMKYDGEVHTQILLGFFITSSPVHDGAVIVKEGRVCMVNAVLPLSTQITLPMGVGTRHRSAIGVTERTDAVVLIVSEQRGEISIAAKGIWKKVKNRQELEREFRRAMKGKMTADAEVAAVRAPEKVAV